jgi:hypothetical protein
MPIHFDTDEAYGIKLLLSLACLFLLTSWFSLLSFYERKADDHFFPELPLI